MTVDIIRGNVVLGSITASVHPNNITLKELARAILEDPEIRVVGDSKQLQIPFRLFSALMVKGLVEK